MSMDPLHQFVIHTIFPLNIAGFDLSFSNASLFMILSICAPLLLFFVGLRSPKLIPDATQSCAELPYAFARQLLLDLNGKDAKPYFSFILSIFLFVLFGNLLGMIPYGFTFTSHIISTFTLALIIFIFTTAIGIFKNGWHFFSLFLPKGTPMLMAPFLIVIECISFIFRPISLAIRLFANMMAGHTMLKVFAGFTVSLGIWGFIPLAVNIFLIGFEFVVACLQAYVFTVLSCLYLNDALNLQH